MLVTALAWMRAFALNEHFAARLVKSGVTIPYASTRLIGVSNNLHTAGRGRNDAKEAPRKGFTLPNYSDMTRGLVHRSAYWTNIGHGGQAGK